MHRPRVPAFPACNCRNDAGVDVLAHQRPLVDCPLSEAIQGAAIVPSLRAWPVQSRDEQALGKSCLLWTGGVRGFL